MEHENGWLLYWEVKGKFTRQIWLGRLALILSGIALLGGGYLIGFPTSAQNTTDIWATSAPATSNNASSKLASVLVVATAPAHASTGLPAVQITDSNRSTFQTNHTETEIEAHPPQFPRTGFTEQGQDRRPEMISWVSASGLERWDTIQVAHRIPSANRSRSASEWATAVWFWPAWLPQATCGEPGVVSIAGHVSWYGRPGPFAQLGTIEPQSLITCHWQNQTFNYQVEEIYVVPYGDTTLYQRPLPDASSTLVLYSCTPEIDGIIVVKSRLIDPDKTEI